MPVPRITVWFGLTMLVLLATARATEINAWPGPVEELDAAGNVKSWTALGPFLFDEPTPFGGRLTGFRPLYVRRTAPTGELAETTVLYPLFTYRIYGSSYAWSVFDLINRSGGTEAPSSSYDQTFDIWPIYFSRETGDPATSYHSVMPIWGKVEGLFGFEQISWCLFPLYVRTESHGAVGTYTPWPIVKTTRGTKQGFAVWPLFGHEEKPGFFDRRYFLWPLIWNNTLQARPDAPRDTPPTHQIGFLPFFSSERGPGLVNETYAWPFFGYTDRTVPYRYHETRYFWPFLVQGSGDDRFVDRWGPFYTHSVIKGMDKTWIMWPLLCQTAWTDGNIAHSRTRFFYFLYWHREERSTTNPAASPAEKTYIWPLISTWDNGAGRRQIQLLSPFEGVFADNPRVRAAWSPLFALWRYDQKAPGEVRTSLLWNAITWEHSQAEGSAEFHFGPILSVRDNPAGRSWRFFGLEFASKRARVAPSAP